MCPYCPCDTWFIARVHMCPYCPCHKLLIVGVPYLSCHYCLCDTLVIEVCRVCHYCPCDTWFIARVHNYVSLLSMGYVAYSRCAVSVMSLLSMWYVGYWGVPKSSYCPRDTLFIARVPMSPYFPRDTLLLHVYYVSILSMWHASPCCQYDTLFTARVHNVSSTVHVVRCLLHVCRVSGLSMWCVVYCTCSYVSLLTKWYVVYCRCVMCHYCPCDTAFIAHISLLSMYYVVYCTCRCALCILIVHVLHCLL